MRVEITILLSVLNVFTSALHICGTYLLLNLYQSGSDDPHTVLLVNLSVTENIINLLQFLINIVYLTGLSHQCEYYLKVIRGYGFVTTYYLNMIFLTTDKLLDVILNIRYSFYCNNKSVKYLLKGLWVFSVIITTGITLLHAFTRIKVYELLLMYIYPVLDFIFVITALAAYGFIFRKYRETRVPPTLTSTIKPPNVFTVFRNSRFYIPVLLIATFTLFMVVADITYLSVVIVQEQDAPLVKTVCSLSFALSYLSDAIIYIFLKPAVKKLLVKKLSLRKRFAANNRVVKHGIDGSNDEKKLSSYIMTSHTCSTMNTPV